MTEEELSKFATKLIQRFDNTKIIGAGGEWSGSARHGFMFNPKPKGPSSITTPPPENTGACCYDDGTCAVVTQTICESGGGTYQGDGTDCDPNPCPQPTGACCVGTDCTIETEDDCTGMGGTYQGDDTTCDPNPCPTTPTGACCLGDNSCVIETESECSDDGGTYLGNGSTCVPNPCGGAECTPPQFECFSFCCDEDESCCGPVAGCCPTNTTCCHGRSCCFNSDPDEQCCPEGSITDCCSARGVCCEVGTNLTGCCGEGFHCSGNPFGFCVPDEEPFSISMFDVFWS